MWIAVVHNIPAADLARLAAELKTPDDPDNRCLTYRQLAEFTLETTSDVRFNLDGEPTAKKKMKFSVLPQHLGVVY